MKAKELLEKLSVCNPEDNITFYYLKNNIAHLQKILLKFVRDEYRK